MNPTLETTESPLILVIDDDRFMRVQLRQVLEEEGYRVEEASDGKQGIEAFQRLNPDIVLLDAIMPVMDGFACCAELLRAQNIDPLNSFGVNSSAHGLQNSSQNSSQNGLLNGSTHVAEPQNVNGAGDRTSNRTSDRTSHPAVNGTAIATPAAIGVVDGVTTGIANGQAGTNIAAPELIEPELLEPELLESLQPTEPSIAELAIAEQPSEQSAAEENYDRALKSTPILMITGLEDQQSVDQAFGVGATDYITKPIHWAVLRRRVRRLIDQCQMYRELEDTNLKLEEANHMLKRLASVDGLTQVANRRCFDETMVHEWQRLSRERAPLSLILMDIDYFKKYNDTYGHLAGDGCLKRVAQAIAKAVCRPADLVARYGGEEFAILLPNTDLAGAGHIAEYMREVVQKLNLEHSSSMVSEHVTISIGVATIQPEMNISPTTLINASDKALYLAKSTGRDRACLLTP
jgi:diguanylate cyclase (GGDEF)-like protein